MNKVVVIGSLNTDLVTKIKRLPAQRRNSVCYRTNNQLVVKVLIKLLPLQGKALTLHLLVLLVMMTMVSHLKHYFRKKA